MNKLDAQFWQEKWKEGHTPWDMGQVSPPIKSYIDRLVDPEIKILIPGAGSAHEAVYLFKLGFQNVHVCDWAENAFDHLKKQAPGFPEEHILISDFFELTGTYDLILEQTFFCAISPNRRTNYVQKTIQLLKPTGTITGLFFASLFPFEGPPFGGNTAEYELLFSPFYDIKQLAPSTLSIEQRLGNELFFEFQKK